MKCFRSFRWWCRRLINLAAVTVGAVALDSAEGDPHPVVGILIAIVCFYTVLELWLWLQAAKRHNRSMS